MYRAVRAKAKLRETSLPEGQASSFVINSKGIAEESCLFALRCVVSICKKMAVLLSKDAIHIDTFIFVSDAATQPLICSIPNLL